MTIEYTAKETIYKDVNGGQNSRRRHSFPEWQENADLQVENAVLKNDVRKYKNQLESISDSKKALFCMTDTIKHLI